MPLLLEMLGLHQAVLKPPIDPRVDINNLRRLGVRRYTLQLVVAAESALGLSPASTLALERRVELIQDRCGLRECPQHERPNLTTRDALIELQRYDNLRTDYMPPPTAVLEPRFDRWLTLVCSFLKVFLLCCFSKSNVVTLRLVYTAKSQSLLMAVCPSSATFCQ
ncbi:hypothetical protein FSOLCH5_15506 [Fusarium solani]